jgi:hypothetical protein
MPGEKVVSYLVVFLDLLSTEGVNFCQKTSEISNIMWHYFLCGDSTSSLLVKLSE